MPDLVVGQGHAGGVGVVVEVHIGTANAVDRDLHPHVGAADLGFFDVFETEVLSGMESHCEHACSFRQ